MENKKDYVVFSQKLASWLMWHGNKLLKIKPHSVHNDRYVYYFPDTEYLHRDIVNYKKHMNDNSLNIK